MVFILTCRQTLLVSELVSHNFSTQWSQSSSIPTIHPDCPWLGLWLTWMKLLLVCFFCTSFQERLMRSSPLTRSTSRRWLLMFLMVPVFPACMIATMLTCSSSQNPHSSSGGKWPQSPLDVQVHGTRARGSSVWRRSVTRCYDSQNPSEAGHDQKKSLESIWMDPSLPKFGSLKKRELNGVEEVGNGL